MGQWLPTSSIEAPQRTIYICTPSNFDFDMPDSDVHFAPLLIDGERRAASTGATFTVRSPHTGALASTSAAASSEDCRGAIEAAQRAFPAWEATSFSTRRDIMLRAAETIQSEAWQKKAASVILAEVAAPQAHALFNFGAGVELLKSVATLVNELKGETLPSRVPGGHVFVQRRAQGVMYVFGFALPSTQSPRLIWVTDIRWSRGMLQLCLCLPTWPFPSSAAIQWWSGHRNFVRTRLTSLWMLYRMSVNVTLGTSHRRY